MEEKAQETDVAYSAAGGFASPIPLPPLNQIDATQCIEKIIEPGNNPNTWEVNGDTLVDLGIFHIHDGIEHANTGEACAARCPNNSREAHLPLGDAMCKAGVEARVFADTAKGRKEKADALLGCAKAVVSYAVCLDGAAVSADLGLLWNALHGKMCINWGGPTGSHAGHQGWVQWLHYREYCGSLTDMAVNITVTCEAGKLQMSPTADAVAPNLQDTPLCGTMTQQNQCADCGERHTRCCGAADGAPFFDGCDWNQGLFCDPIGRCVPTPPAPPVPPMMPPPMMPPANCTGDQVCDLDAGVGSVTPDAALESHDAATATVSTRIEDHRPWGD